MEICSTTQVGVEAGKIMKGYAMSRAIIDPPHSILDRAIAEYLENVTELRPLEENEEIRAIRIKDGTPHRILDLVIDAQRQQRAHDQWAEYED